MHFAQKTKPEGEAVGSWGAMRQVGHAPACGHALRPAGGGGGRGGGGTGAERCAAGACCGACLGRVWVFRVRVRVLGLGFRVRV